MARPHKTKWEDPLVGVDRIRLCQAIERAGRIPRRTLAESLRKRLGSDVSPTSQTLDYLCKGPQKRCRASLRRALAEELEIPEIWLDSEAPLPGVTIDNLLPDGGEFRGAGKLAVEWGEMVFSLKLPPDAHSAMIDLPGAVGQASLLLGLISTDDTGAPRADLQIRRAGMRDLEAWYMWLKTVIRIQGPEKAGRTLAKALPHLRERFSRVSRYAPTKPSGRPKR